MTAMDVMTGIPHLLWTTSWQAGVMAGGIWIACRQWPRMPGNLRVMLWWLVSLKFVMGLVWTQPIPLPVLPAAAPDVSVTQAIGSNDLISTGSNVSASTPIRSAKASAINTITSYGLAAASGLWIVGVLVQGALLLRQLVRTRRVIAGSQPVTGHAAELFDDLVTRLDVRASCPVLRASNAIATPQVTGLTRPVILLPIAALDSFSTRELSLTLCHELMHVKRFDLWHGWIPSVAARLFFFHPLARLAAREYAIAREAACDARVLAFMDAPAYDYGQLLMRLGVTAREAAPAAAGASPTLHTLKRRLLMLHDASPDVRGLSPRWWALAALATVLVIPMRPTAAQNPQNPQNQQNQQNPQNQANLRAADQKQDQDEAWVFLQDDDNMATHGSSTDVADAKRVKGNSSEPLIWFRREGRAYVIRNRETIDLARALFIPQEELHRSTHGFHDRELLLRAQESALRTQGDALRDQMRDFDRKVEEAAAATHKTIPPPPRPSEEDRRRVRQELEARESQLRQAEANRRNVAANQETIGMQQRLIGEQQQALAAEQAAVARQEQELSRAMEREMRALFERAVATGVATPVK
jgi:bla regulator protein blaR1